MKKLSRRVFIFILVLILPGCATLPGKIGLASEDYVEERLQALRSDLEEEFETNKALLESYSDTAAKLEEVLHSLEGTVETTDQLKELAVVLEERLMNLPDDTIQRLADILNDYLQDD